MASASVASPITACQSFGSSLLSQRALRAWKGQTALLVAVELCSLTLQREDLSIPNIIASELFGDGAACVVLQGAERGGVGPRIVATRSVLYPDTELIMGWEVVDSGFKVVLSAKVPQLVREYTRRDVDGFLAEHGLRREDVKHWVAHAGGPKVPVEGIEGLVPATRALRIV